MLLTAIPHRLGLKLYWIVSICLSNPFFQFPGSSENRASQLMKLYLIVLI